VRRLLPVVLALSACGDPLANGNFEGDVKMSFEAIVCGDQHESIAPANPQLGILWKQVGPQGRSWKMTEVTPVDTPVFPAVVEVDVLEAPPRDADLGCPILFDDLNGDELYGNEEPILAVSWNQFLGFDPSEESFGLVEGICDEAGAPSGEVNHFADRAVNVTFLDQPSLSIPTTAAPGACVPFF
jgi:hypothetical protein